MSFNSSLNYDESVYKRLEESVLDYLDDDCIDRFVPAIKKVLCTELAYRRERVRKLEFVLSQLLPGEGYGEPGPTN